MQIQVSNKSQALASKEDLIVAMCVAITSQLTHHAAPAWNRLPASVSFCADPKHVIPGALHVYLFDDADQAGALGYHDETPAGDPYAKVFAKTILDNGGTILGPNGVAACLSHEVLEMWADPTIDYWAQSADGTLYALELGDPVENDSYVVVPAPHAHPVFVSNFVFPSWFDDTPSKSTRLFDYLGKLKAPFTMDAGGYVIVMQGGNVSQRFGEAYPAWKKAGKTHPASRTSQRAPYCSAED